MDSDPLKTQRDVGSAVAGELRAAGFEDADEIGRGGFGIVYRCTQVALDRVVAVKVLTAEIDANRERFLREQRAMGRLTGHPNIVGVLQVGQTETGHPYLVMQYHRQGSLDARIKQIGLLPPDEVLRIGVKMSGALESAHRLEILHRDIKPANILLTDYGEPALCDFGIAHIAGGFKTAAGTFTGSPAFTAPELLSGDQPSRASDVYGLGATLFCALTGHAAYERRSGEQVVAQFLRIATEPAPDLREHGIPDGIAHLVATAMSRDPDCRPSAVELGEQLHDLQARHGFATDEMALYGEARGRGPQPAAVTPAMSGGIISNLPAELTSFVGRRDELAEMKRLLAVSRLVTLTGIGGVGKTRLALRAAADVAAEFADGVRLVELGDLRDGLLLVEVVAAGLGLRDESTQLLSNVLVEFLCARRLLLVLDNCEQVVDDAAKLADTLLRTCPDLRIIATSRERLGVDGEMVLPMAPLRLAEADELFAQRAGAALPGFALSEDKATVATICARLEGLPLAIELAAARVRTMSPDQILERLADRYALLTHGSRSAPTRQQTLSWSIGWSYDLCTTAEQQLWTRLSIFAGSFELEAAEDVCGGELRAQDIDDLISALVDKSILLRSACDGLPRFRMLETLRDYGRQRLQRSGEGPQLRRRHMNWYRGLALDAAADWFGPRQVQWIERLTPEWPNLREALEFSLTESPETALGIAAAVYPCAVARGALTEMRHWLDRTLTATPPRPTRERISALYGAAIIAGLQGDVAVTTARALEARVLTEQTTDPRDLAMSRTVSGFAAMLSGDLDGAYTLFEDAVNASEDPAVQVPAMILLGWTLEFRGDISGALVWQEKALSVTENAGESVFRSFSLWSIGIAWWRQGRTERAEQLLRECLQFTQRLDDPRNGAACLEALAWIERAQHNPRRAVVLMAAAEALGRWAGTPPAVLPDLVSFHEECERRARESLDAEQFDAAQRQGSSMRFDEAVTFALDQQL